MVGGMSKRGGSGMSKRGRWGRRDVKKRWEWMSKIGGSGRHREVGVVGTNWLLHFLWWQQPLSLTPPFLLGAACLPPAPSSAPSSSFSDARGRILTSLTRARRPPRAQICWYGRRGTRPCSPSSSCASPERCPLQYPPW